MERLAQFVRANDKIYEDLIQYITHKNIDLKSGTIVLDNPSMELFMQLAGI